MPDLKTLPPLYDRPRADDIGRPHQNDIGQGFLDALNGAAALAAQIVPAVASAAGLASGPIGLGSLTSAAGALGGGGSYQQLLALQMKVQQETLQFQSASNISKAAHDAKMNAVRNVRP
jgi:hypothetical protein